MSNEDNNMDGEEVLNTHENVFKISSNPAPIIKLTVGNLSGDYVYLPNDELPQQWLTKHETEISCFGCIPTEIIDPNNFWVQLERTQNEFLDMMTNLQYFYRRHSRILAALARNICEDLNVVVLRNNCYFRCRIVGLTPTHVQVHYVDYGKIAYAPNEKVYHLHRDFGVLKSQAIHCKMFNLKAPTNHMLYPISARIATIRMIKDRLTVALIDDIRQDTRTLELSLHSLDETSIPISDWLVRHGHAKFICTQIIKR